MSDTLGDLLRRTADAGPRPAVDLDVLVREAGRQQRRRRTGVVAASAVLVGGLVVTTLALRSGDSGDIEPGKPPPSQSTAVDPEGGPVQAHGRPLVYAEGATVNDGEVAFQAEQPVAFIRATDDGVVYEASLDHRLWFSDGTTSSVIGRTWYAAAPTPHPESVTTGQYGSLVVWENTDVDAFVVYDTASRKVVGEISFAEYGDSRVVYVDEEHVYFTPQGRPGCWVYDLDDFAPCTDPHLFRFDVASGTSTNIGLRELDAEMGARSRAFRRDGRPLEPGFVVGANFTQDGNRLVVTDDDGEPRHLFRTNGDEVRLRLPLGYTAPGLPDGTSVIQVSQWLDDDHVAIWATRGEGDLPPQHGDLLVCQLPDGVCRVAVPESSAAYVAPGG